MLHRPLARAARALAAVLVVLLLAPGPSLAVGAPAPKQDAGGASARGRVLVVGFDGADWRTTERLMDEGLLPNLAKLRESGSAGPLVSTEPAESAAGWAAINTGANPARNGVPSFVERVIDGGSVRPDFAHVDPRTLDVTEGARAGQGSALERILNGTDPIVLGVVTLLVALLLFRFVLRASTPLAVVIAALLGAGAWFASSSAGPGVPARIPTYVGNEVRLDGFWVEAARQGHPSIALQAPMAFDRPGVDGARTLYGLGVPDVRGSINGDWTIYSTDQLVTGRVPVGEEVGSTGTRFRVDFEEPDGGGEPRIDSFVYGPIDFLKADRLRARWEEIAAIQNDMEAWNALGFQESNELAEEKDDCAKELAQMDQPIREALKWNRPLGKSYRHRMQVPLVVEPAGDAFDVTLGTETKTLEVGAWSDFYTVRFEFSSSFAMSAITRAKVVAAEPFELYLDTLQYDPREPSFWQPTSDPPSFAGQLSAKLGAPYETLGWGCMTNQLKDRGVDPEIFLEDVEFTMRWRRKLFEESLTDGAWEVLYAVFSTTDRIQHMMYRYYDPGHPYYDPEEASREITFFGETMTLADTIPAIYRQMDSVVGDAVAALGAEDTLLLCADHGFTSYRRGVNVNNWLAAEGFLTLRDDATSGGLGSIDWSKTQAYSLGLGMVYLNLEGREPDGIVPMADADAVMDRICAAFLAARDEGRVVGSSAVKIKGLYEGPEEWGTAEFPCSDIMLGFAEYYRTSWSTVDGGMPVGQGPNGNAVPGAVYEDNDSLWSGDHASNDPRLVSGIFFSSRPVVIPEGGYSVLHIAPTVLDRLGVEIPEHFDAAPLALAGE